MKFLKLSIILVTVLALTMPAWAGNEPEFDAVGLDAANVFAVFNAIQYGQVIQKTGVPFGAFGPVNLISDFTDPVLFQLGPFDLQERFTNTAGQFQVDPCFADFGYVSHLTDTWNEAEYEWLIVLQMKPESDINLNIYDCVRKHNELDPADWDEFEQTGRYRAPWGQLMFLPASNPEVTVKAWPGDYATPGFTDPFTMDARTLPGLAITPLDQALYTSKALWSEGIVMVMPETGVTNATGETMYNLKQGDIMQVQIYINPNPADIFYGQDNVILKYIGISGTYYYAIP